MCVLISLCFPFPIHSFSEAVQFIYTYKFIYFWLHWVLIALCGLSLLSASGSYSSLRGSGFSLQ